MLKVRIDYLPKGHRNRPGHYMQPIGLLFHTTNNWNDGAGDEMHGQYMKTVTDRIVSWHDTVDKDSWTRHIPHNENAWHAGDGSSGHYNRNWLGLEIACEAVKYGEPLDAATYNNAVDVAAQIMMEHGWDTEDRLEPHRIVYGKDCPHHTLFDTNKFKRDVLDLIRKRKAEAEQPKKLTKYTDVPAGHWAEKYIAAVQRENLMSGYPDGTFQPDKPLTRAELAVVLAISNNLI